VIELRRDGDVERIEVEHEDSYRLELENLRGPAIRGEAELLLGRKTRSGWRARALEALHASATSNAPVFRCDRTPRLASGPRRCSGGGRRADAGRARVDRACRLRLGRFEDVVCSPRLRQHGSACARRSSFSSRIRCAPSIAIRRSTVSLARRTFRCRSGVVHLHVAGHDEITFGGRAVHDRADTLHGRPFGGRGRFEFSTRSRDDRTCSPIRRSSLAGSAPLSNESTCPGERLPERITCGSTERQT